MTERMGREISTEELLFYAALSIFRGRGRYYPYWPELIFRAGAAAPVVIVAMSNLLVDGTAAAAKEFTKKV